MHEVQVQILQAEVLQGVLDGELDVFRVVVQLEELGSDEDLLTGNAGLLNTLADLGLVTVSPGAAESSAKHNGSSSVSDTISEYEDGCIPASIRSNDRPRAI